MTAFPGGVYSPRLKENKAGIAYDAAKKTIGYAEDITKLDDEVVAIETELGVNPKGIFASVRAWLDVLYAHISASGASHTYIDQAVTIGANVGFGNVTIVGDLKPKYWGQSHYLTIRPDGVVTANRMLSLKLNNANRILTLAGNPTLADWFDQSVKVAASPKFSNAYITNNFGIGTDTPESQFHMVVNDVGKAPFVNSVFTLEKTAGPYFQFLSGNNTQAGFIFGDADDAVLAGLEYNHVNDRLHFRGFNWVKRLTINAVGNIGIGTETPLCKLQIAGAITSGTLTFALVGPTDDLDVSGVNTIFINAGANAVTIGGLVGGVDGQILNIVIVNPANNVTLEHAEGGGNQDILLHRGADETIDGHYGGWTLVCHAGVDWHDASHAKHI